MKASALVRFHPIREVLNLFGSTAHEPGQALEICYLPKTLRTAVGPAPAGRFLVRSGGFKASRWQARRPSDSSIFPLHKNYTGTAITSRSRPAVSKYKIFIGRRLIMYKRYGESGAVITAPSKASRLAPFSIRTLFSVPVRTLYQHTGLSDLWKIAYSFLPFGVV